MVFNVSIAVYLYVGFRVLKLLKERIDYMIVRNVDFCAVDVLV